MAVTVEDVVTTARTAVTSDADKAAVAQWIADVQLRLRLRFGDRLSELDPEAVDYVVREVVAARLLRPRDEASSQSVAVDDATVTRRWETSTGGGRSWDEWMAWLDGLLPDAMSGEAFSIRLGGAW